MNLRAERGAASVEHAGLVVLVATLVLVCLAAAGSGPPSRAGRELASALGRKIRCAGALPGPCWRDALTVAYGRATAGAVRALAPLPRPIEGPSGLPIVPVDFRYCRHESCALPGRDPGHLTTAGRRVTAFTAVLPGSAGRGVEVTYWLYRPGIGWARAVRVAGDAELGSLARTPLPESADPRLVPLETLAGRDHYAFAPGEEPPWRFSVRSRYP